MRPALTGWARMRRAAMTKLLLTAAEVAEILRLPSTKAVFALAASGALPGVVRIGRRFRVRRDELLRHL